MEYLINFFWFIAGVCFAMGFLTRKVFKTTPELEDVQNHFRKILIASESRIVDRQTIEASKLALKIAEAYHENAQEERAQGALAVSLALTKVQELREKVKCYDAQT